MAESDHPLRRQSPLRRRRLAAATFAIVAHLSVLCLILFATPRLTSYARDPRSISVDIVAPVQVRKLPAQPRSLQPNAGRPAPTPPKAAADHETPTTLAPPAPLPAEIPSALPRGDDNAALGKALRNSVIGCTHADAAGLTDAERQQCRDNLAANRADIPDLSQLAISPEKRAIYDAAWKADHSPQHMAGVACLAVFGAGKLQWLHPSQGVKLGPLPCYVFTPKATFSADPPHARGWQ